MPVTWAFAQSVGPHEAPRGPTRPHEVQIPRSEHRKRPRPTGTSVTTWHCSGCCLPVEAVAAEVGHRCPARRLGWVRFVADEESGGGKAVEAVEGRARARA